MYPDTYKQSDNSDNQTPSYQNFPVSPPPEYRQSIFGSIKDNLSTILILLAAPTLAILITMFMFRTYQVDGPSMETTLQDKDRLIVNKLPVSISKITHHTYVPHRYDIIIFNHKGQFNSFGVIQKKQLIKRVIGLPGDRVVVKSGSVSIFNKEHPNGFLVDKFGPEDAVIDTTEGNIDQTVGQNEIFVMGDNRLRSLDSRALGTVSTKDIVGKLEVRIYPFSKWQTY